MSRWGLLLGVALLSCKSEQARAAPDPAVVAQPVAVTPFEPRGPVPVPRVRLARWPSHEAALSPLRAKDLVGGEQISIAGHEPPFHLAWRTVFSAIGPTTTAWLAEDDHPAVRALGLWNLAVAKDDHALVRHFCDRDRVRLCPEGCVCSEASIGELAQRWAVDPAWLSTSGASSPREPFTKSERTRLAVALLGVDGCDASREWRAYVEGDDYRSLRAHAPTLPGWMLVKALARLLPDSPELIAILDDPGETPDARLAAASALTRSGDASAIAALDRNAGFLDARRPGLSGGLRRSIRPRLTIDAATLVLVLGDPAPRLETARTLLALSDGLAAHVECWDIERDTAYELERFLPRPRLEDWIEQKNWLELLDGAERARFVTNVRKAVAVLDRTCH